MRTLAMFLKPGVLSLCITCMATIAAPASAASAAHDTSPFAGHWEADLRGDGKIHTFVFEFTVRGDSLGGRLSIAQREGDVPIAGSVKGNHIHFEQFGLWDGSIAKGELRLTRGLDGGKVQHLVGHRAVTH